MKQILESNDKNILQESVGFKDSVSKVTRKKHKDPLTQRGRNNEIVENKRKNNQQSLNKENKNATKVLTRTHPTSSIVLSPLGEKSTTKIPPFTLSPSLSEDGGRGPPKSITLSQFRAKPPKVLKMNPFKPILEHIHSKPRRMTLHTEIRVTERREFQFKQILREERLAMEREQKKRKEEKEIARLRRESVHRAQPMPNFRPAPRLATSPLPLTNPKSPNFCKRVYIRQVSVN